MPTADQLPLLLADAYCAAARGGAPMRDATDALEAIRAAASGEDHPFSTWDLLDDHVGRTAGALRQALQELREGFVTLTIETAVSEQRQAFLGDADAAWTEWLRAYVRALVKWRLRLCDALADADLRFPDQASRLVELIRRRNPYIRQERWAETYRLFVTLAMHQSLTDQDRAELYIRAAEIHMFVFYKRPMAKPLLQRAERLHPDSAIVSGAWGEYWMLDIEPESPTSGDKARKHFDLAIRRDQRLVSAYTGTGQTYQRQGDLEAAERWYREAVRVRPGDASGYAQLLRLYGQPGLLEAHEADLAPLFEQAITVGPGGEYSLCLDMGFAYQQGKRYEDTQRWYDRAVALDPTNPIVYFSKGHAYREQEALDEARAAFERAMELAPDSMDGYWAMALLHEQQDQYVEAIDWYRKSLRRRPRWYVYIHTRIGQLLVKLDRHAEAEVELLKALRADRNDTEVLASLHSLTDEYYQQRNDSAAAMRLQQEILEVMGAGYRGTYHNRQGNILFYGTDYLAAADQYREAITWNADDPVFHSNLAVALEYANQAGNRLQNLEEAIRSLGQALKLDAGNTDYTERLERHTRDRALIAMHGERVLEMTPLVTPLAAALGEDLVQHLLDPGTTDLSAEAQTLVDSMRQRLRDRYGVQIPGVRFRRMEDADQHEGQYVFELRGVPVASGSVAAGKRYLAGPLPPAQRRPFAGPEALDPATGTTGTWVDETEALEAGLDGSALWPVLEYPLRHLEAVLEWNLAELVGHQEVDYLVEQAGESFGTLREGPELTVLTGILRGLVRERVPITPLEPILERILELRQDGLSPPQIVERLRSVPEIQLRLPGRDATDNLYLLGPRLASELLASIRGNQDNVVAVVDRRTALAAVRALQRELDPSGPVTVAVETAELRPLVGALVQLARSRASVVSAHELGPDRGELRLVELDE
jgi:tetratricopeptide (TPR) repeat protein